MLLRYSFTRINAEYWTRNVSTTIGELASLLKNQIFDEKRKKFRPLTAVKTVELFNLIQCKTR